jgi:chorismate mutase
MQQEAVQKEAVQQDTGYYVIRKQAVPDVLLKVVEAKKLLESGKVKTVHEAAERLGISRSSFYKYKEDIYEFHDSLQGTTLTLTFQMNDEVGLLSYVLNLIAEFGANILTIHQSIPLNGVASISITIQVLPTTRDIMEMISLMEKTDGVHKVHITGRSATLT